MLNFHEKRVHANATMLDKQRMSTSAGMVMNIVLRKWFQMSPTVHASR